MADSDEVGARLRAVRHPVRPVHRTRVVHVESQHARVLAAALVGAANRDGRGAGGGGGSRQAPGRREREPGGQAPGRHRPRVGRRPGRRRQLMGERPTRVQSADDGAGDAGQRGGQPERRHLARATPDEDPAVHDHDGALDAEARDGGAPPNRPVRRLQGIRAALVVAHPHEARRDVGAYPWWMPIWTDHSTAWVVVPTATTWLLNPSPSYVVKKTWVVPTAIPETGCRVPVECHFSDPVAASRARTLVLAGTYTVPRQIRRREVRRRVRRPARPSRTGLRSAPIGPAPSRPRRRRRRSPRPPTARRTRRRRLGDSTIFHLRTPVAALKAYRAASLPLEPRAKTVAPSITGVASRAVASVCSVDHSSSCVAWSYACRWPLVSRTTIRPPARFGASTRTAISDNTLPRAGSTTSRTSSAVSGVVRVTFTPEASTTTDETLALAKKVSAVHSRFRDVHVVRPERDLGEVAHRVPGVAAVHGPGRHRDDLPGERLRDRVAGRVADPEVTLDDPAAVGVPVTTPFEDSCRPAGSDPDAIDQVYGAVPPVALRVSWYGAVTWPAGIFAVAIASGLAPPPSTSAAPRRARSAAVR